MGNYKAIPIGVEFYKDMIDKEYYYIDKTLLIRDLLEIKSGVTLFTRPRRFGKTLALTMLKAYFEKEILPDGTVNDNSRYFLGKKIMDAGEEYTKHMGQYPVIFLSLKSAKRPTYNMAYTSIVDDLQREFSRHRYVLSGDSIADENREKFIVMLKGNKENIDYAKALLFLSECLEQYHGKKTVILIDEYDVPLENAYFQGFYDDMVNFIRTLFESALKTNDSLNFAVVTGCLRISKESIFTGLNNLDVVSVLDESYAEYFGFVPQEVEGMLYFYGLDGRKDEVREWYNGYLFGKTEVYNPWSVIKYVKDILEENTEFPKPYWSNTSSNSVIKELIDNADNETKSEIEKLIEGGTIEKPVHEDITYGDVHRSQDNLWNFLFFTGYLKMVEKRFAGRNIYLTVKIPNYEILYIYENHIMDRMQKRVKATDFTVLYNALISGDTKVFEEIINKQLREMISVMDSSENFYHGFLLGLLGAMQDYKKISNRESGEGRYDIVLEPYDMMNPVIILEIKRAVRFQDMEKKCREALIQIEEKHYDAEWVYVGYPVIKKYGVCFCRKNCMMRTFDDVGIMNDSFAGDITK